jgi:tetratricopeptide (TPR) repeat protein
LELVRSRIFSCLFVILAICTRVFGAAEESASERLRALARMPMVTVNFGWSFSPKTGVKLDTEKALARERIVDIEKALTGTPADAERYALLGELYLDVPDYDGGRKANVKAVDLFRRRVEMQPDDALLLADYGDALFAVSKLDEAESVLRKAVKLAPKQSQCWGALGRYLESAAATKLEPKNANNTSDSTDKSTPLRPSAEQLAAAQRLLDEAESCFDKAVAASTNSALPYVQRAMHTWAKYYYRQAFNKARGQQDDEQKVARSIAATEALPDLEKAVQLNPKDFRVVGTAVFMQVFSANTKKNEPRMQMVKFDEMDDQNQKSVRGKMALLENASQSAEPKSAAAATEMLAFCQGPLLGDLAGCLESLRRAVHLDKSREGAWHMLIAGMAGQGRLQDAAPICEENIAHKDSALNRLMYAKILFKLHRLPQADEQAKAALRLDMNDFAANVAVAAIALKRGTNLTDLISAEQPLARAEAAVQTRLDVDRDAARQSMIDFCLTKAIYCGLTERLDTARQYAEHVFRLDPENQEAKEVLSALNR